MTQPEAGRIYLAFDGIYDPGSEALPHRLNSAAISRTACSIPTNIAW